jgi:hypothetical protein
MKLIQRIGIGGDNTQIINYILNGCIGLTLIVSVECIFAKYTCKIKRETHKTFRGWMLCPFGTDIPMTHLLCPHWHMSTVGSPPNFCIFLPTTIGSSGNDWCIRITPYPSLPPPTSTSKRPKTPPTSSQYPKASPHVPLLPIHPSLPPQKPPTSVTPKKSAAQPPLPYTRSNPVRVSPTSSHIPKLPI